MKKKIIFCSENVLTPEELNWVTSQVLNGEFVDGKITAGVAASGGEGQPAIKSRFSSGAGTQ